MIRKYYKASLSIVDQSVVSLGNFLAVILPAKVLEIDVFGKYVIAISIVFILTSLTKGLVTSPLRITGSDHIGENFSEYVSAQSLYLILISFPVGLLASLCFVWLADATIAEAASLFVSFFLFQIHDFFRAVRVVQLRWELQLFADFVLHGSRIAILGILMLNDQMSIVSALIAFAISSFLSLLVSRCTDDLCAVSWRSLRKAFDLSWGYGQWLLGEAVVTVAATRGYVLLVAGFLGSAEAGVFGSIFQIASIVNVFHIAASSYATPYARRSIRSGDYAKWRRVLVTSGAVVVFATLITMFPAFWLSADILTLVYTFEWASYGHVLEVMAVAMILASLNLMLAVGFQTAGFPEIGLKAKVVAAVVTAISSVPLMVYFGVAGAAFGLVLTQLCWLLVFGFELTIKQRLTKTSVSNRLGS